MEQFDIQHAITDVSGVSVKPDKSGAGLLMGNKPSMQPEAVFRRKENLFESQSYMTWIATRTMIGMENESVLDPATAEQGC
ncbi:MAG TPA: hypothetical protein VF089_04915 [Candidatus Binatia bacterium]